MARKIKHKAKERKPLGPSVNRRWCPKSGVFSQQTFRTNTYGTMGPRPRSVQCEADTYHINSKAKMKTKKAWFYPYTVFFFYPSFEATVWHDKCTQVSVWLITSRGKEKGKPTQLKYRAINSIKSKKLWKVWDDLWKLKKKKDSYTFKEEFSSRGIERFPTKAFVGRILQILCSSSFPAFCPRQLTPL